MPAELSVAARSSIYLDRPLARLVLLFTVFYTAFQSQNFLFDCCYRFLKNFIIFARWIFKSPILSIFARQIRTIYITTHCYHNIYSWKFIQPFAVLRLLHINIIKLFHKPYSFLIDFRHCFCSSGIAFKDIGSQIFSKSLGNLTSTRIVNTNEGYLWLFAHTLSRTFRISALASSFFKTLP